MLGEIALTPDVFRQAGFPNPDLHPLYIDKLREPLLEEVLVRDLHNGDWYESFGESLGELTPLAKELLKALKKRRRLCPSPVSTNTLPEVDEDWCNEALHSHQVSPLDCVVTTPDTKNRKWSFRKQPLISSLEKLNTNRWWQTKEPSVDPKRSMEDYLEYLDRVLTHSNSLMFIDPHLDPTRPGYAEFHCLLDHANRNRATSLVEIHRVCYVGPKRDRDIIAVKEWEDRFRKGLAPHLGRYNFEIHVFVWDDFHDRCLISDLIGILMQNGFDVDRGRGSVTRWGRMGRKTRDRAQREFHINSRSHTLQGEFKLS
jgi:hypothetical protein